MSSPLRDDLADSPPAPTPAGAPADGPRQRLAEARRALYRGAIVEAAERVFAEHGYDAARVQAIAKAAGLSLATFYGVFPGKWEVLRALQHDRLTLLMQRVGTLVMSANDPFDRLRFGLEGYLRFHMEHPAFLRVQLREQIPWGTLDELHTPEQTRAWRAGLEMLTAAFGEAMAAGLFADDDPEACARMATAMSQVRLVLWLDRGMRQTPDQVVRAAMLQLVRTFSRPEALSRLSQRIGVAG
jgi:AcrR family transcriptional regulator